MWLQKLALMSVRQKFIENLSRRDLRLRKKRLPVHLLPCGLHIAWAMTSGRLVGKVLAWISTEGNSPKDLRHRAANRSGTSGEHAKG